MHLENGMMSRINFLDFILTNFLFFKIRRVDV